MGGVYCRTLQEGFPLAALTPVRLAAIYVRTPPPHVSIGATPLVCDHTFRKVYTVYRGFVWADLTNQ